MASVRLPLRRDGSRRDQEERAEFAQPVKVGATLVIDLNLKCIELRKAVAHDDAALFIEFFLAVEHVDDTTADDCVQGHQRTFLVRPDMRPVVILMCLPKIDKQLSVHDRTCRVDRSRDVHPI